MSERKNVTRQELATMLGSDSFGDWLRILSAAEIGDRQRVAPDFARDMAGSLWSALPATSPASEHGRPPLDPATKAHDDAYMAGLIRGREIERESATPPASETVEAAWEALYRDIKGAYEVAWPAVSRAMRGHRPRIEAAIRADETRDCQARADAEYERGRVEADERVRALREAARTLIIDAEVDDNFEGEFTDWLVSETNIEALRAALDATPEDAHKP